jgi:hypothetical protein
MQNCSSGKASYTSALLFIFEFISDLTKELRKLAYVVKIDKYISIMLFYLIQYVLSVP